MSGWNTHKRSVLPRSGILPNENDYVYCSDRCILYLLVHDEESERLTPAKASGNGLYSSNAQTKAGSSLDQPDKDGLSHFLYTNASLPSVFLSVYTMSISMSRSSVTSLTSYDCRYERSSHVHLWNAPSATSPRIQTLSICPAGHSVPTDACHKQRIRMCDWLIQLI